MLLRSQSAACSAREKLDPQIPELPERQQGTEQSIVEQSSKSERGCVLAKLVVSGVNYAVHNPHIKGHHS
jgi:hypothetical protein